MKKVRYTAYMLERLEFRNVPKEVVEIILNEATERYFDVETCRLIAIRRVKYKGRDKRLMVAYEEQEEEITAVTVHTVTKRQVQSRIKRRRWVPK